MPKRTDYISRDDYFMWVALLSAHRSKDPMTQVWACIVNQDKHIVGVWYNGFPRGCSDEEFPWDKDLDNLLNNKHSYVVHAEANAILNANGSTKEATMYVALFPCNECAKLIIQSWIRNIIYLADSRATRADTLASKRMLDASWVIYSQLKPQQPEITILFDMI